MTFQAALTTWISPPRITLTQADMERVCALDTDQPPLQNDDGAQRFPLLDRAEFVQLKVCNMMSYFDPLPAELTSNRFLCARRMSPRRRW